MDNAAKSPDKLTASVEATVKSSLLVDYSHGQFVFGKYPALSVVHVVGDDGQSGIVSLIMGHLAFCL